MNEELFMPDSYPPEADGSSSYARGAQAPACYNYSSSRAIMNEEFFNSVVKLRPRRTDSLSLLKQLNGYTIIQLTVFFISEAIIWSNILQILIFY